MQNAHIIRICLKEGGAQNVCRKLYALRKEKALSQDELAQILNVSRQSVSKWETGVSMPELDKIIALSDFFEVSVDYLVKDESSEKSLEDVDDVEKLDKIQSKYEYKSKASFLGLPLIHICYDMRPARMPTAKGIIAIGARAVVF